MLHVVEHTFLDTVRLIPFLFLTYLAMEYLEHKASDKMEGAVRKAGKWGPLLGSLAGVVPQCGFSAAASGLYAGRVITLGSLLAIYLSTSDEMLPILLSARAEWGLIARILLWKVVIGMTVGFLADLLASRLHGRAVPVGKAAADTVRQEGDAAAGVGQPGKAAADTVRQEGSEAAGVGQPGGSEAAGACRCEKGVFRSALFHTLQIAFFILLITFILNLMLEWGGEDVLTGLLFQHPLVGPVLSGLVGLIPNCVGSIVVTQLYMEGAMEFGTMMAGLLTGTGVGILVLCRTNPHPWENFKIIALVYGIGVMIGILL